MFDLLEARPHGRLLRYDPATRQTTVLLRDLYFANGVALSRGEDFVLVNETYRYRTRRFWLKGPKAGTSDVFLDNLPGFPDNIDGNRKGSFWLALFTVRNPDRGHAPSPSVAEDAPGQAPALRLAAAEALRPGPGSGRGRAHPSQPARPRGPPRSPDHDRPRARRASSISAPWTGPGSASWRCHEPLPQDPHREPGRDRGARRPHVPGDGPAHRGRVLRGGPRRPPHPRGRRGGADRSRRGPALVPEHRRDPGGGSEHRGRCGPPRLRLPEPERRLRRCGGRGRPRLHRSARPGAPSDGRQEGRPPADGRGRSAGGARVRRRRSAGRDAPGGGPPDRLAASSSSRRGAAAARGCAWWRARPTSPRPLPPRAARRRPPSATT